jgi:hypothetical protein
MMHGQSSIKFELSSLQRQEDENCKGNLHLLFLEVQFVLTQQNIRVSKILGFPKAV